MSSEKYELAQDELEVVLEKLQEELKGLETSQGEVRKRFVQMCSSKLDEGSKALDEMESEARTAPLQYRAEMLGSVRQYRSKLTAMQSQFHRSRASGLKGDYVGKDRSINSGTSTVSNQYRQQVLTGTAALERTGDSLNRAQQVAVETDAVAEEIIGDLGTQRETLERTRNRLIDTDVELGRSRKVLRKMYLNVFSNKIILILIIVVEVCILGGVLLWKYGLK